MRGRSTSSNCSFILFGRRWSPGFPLPPSSWLCASGRVGDALDWSPRLTPGVFCACQAITAGVLAGCSDAIAQKISGTKKLQLRRLLLIMVISPVFRLLLLPSHFEFFEIRGGSSFRIFLRPPRVISFKMVGNIGFMFPSVFLPKVQKEVLGNG